MGTMRIPEETKEEAAVPLIPLHPVSDVHRLSPVWASWRAMLMGNRISSTSLRDGIEIDSWRHGKVVPKRPSRTKMARYTGTAGFTGVGQPITIHARIVTRL